MFCPHCGSEIKLSGNFCVNCGGRLGGDSSNTAQVEYGAPTTIVKTVYVKSSLADLFSEWKNIMYVVFVLWVICGIALISDWFTVTMPVFEISESLSVYEVLDFLEENYIETDVSKMFYGIVTVATVLMILFLAISIVCFCRKKKGMFASGMLLSVLSIAFSSFILLIVKTLISDSTMSDDTTIEDYIASEFMSEILEISAAPWIMLIAAAIAFVLLIVAKKKYVTDTLGYGKYNYGYRLPKMNGSTMTQRSKLNDFLTAIMVRFSQFNLK